MRKNLKINIFHDIIVRRDNMMITFENITQTKSVYTHFLPVLLIPLITPYLKKADIPFETLGLED